MVKFTVRKGIEANLPTQGMAEEGCVYHTTDTGNAYLGGANGNLIPLNRSPYYGTCPTAAGTVAKVVTLDSEVFSLSAGTMIAVRFDNANTVTPTLNVNGTGAVAVKSYGTTAVGTTPTGSWHAGEVVNFVYDGSYWMRIGGFPDASDYALDANVVHKTGGETIAGVKSFSNTVNINDVISINNSQGNVDISSESTNDGQVLRFLDGDSENVQIVGVATPTVGNHAANKKYVDDSISGINAVSADDPRLYDGYEIASQLTSSAARNSYIATATKDWTWSTTYKHFAIPANGIRKIVVTANSENPAYISFLKNYVLGTSSSDNTTSDYAGDYTCAIRVMPDETMEFAVPSDAEVIYIYAGSSLSAKPTSVKLTGLAITRANEDVIDNSMDAVTSDALYDDIVIAGYRQHEMLQYVISNSMLIKNTINSSTLKWQTSTSYHLRFRIPKHLVSVDVTANANYLTRVAFLTGEESSSGNTPSFVTGTSLTNVEAGETVKFAIPSGALYMYVFAGQPDSYNYMPSSITGTGDRPTENMPLFIGNKTYDGSDTVEIDEFEGASAEHDGGIGLVPAPTVSDKDKFLKGDGTWATPEGGGGGGGGSADPMQGADNDNDGVGGTVPAPLKGQQQFVLAGSAQWRQPFHLGCGVVGVGSASYNNKWYLLLQGSKSDSTATDETIVILVTRHTTSSSYVKGVVGLLVVDIRKSGSTVNLNKAWLFNSISEVKSNIEVTTCAETENSTTYRRIKVYAKTSALGGYSAKILSSSGWNNLTSTSEMRWISRSERLGDTSTYYSSIPSGETVATENERPLMIAAPTDSSHAATKGYVDNLFSTVRTKTYNAWTSLGFIYQRSDSDAKNTLIYDTSLVPSKGAWMDDESYSDEEGFLFDSGKWNIDIDVMVTVNDSVAKLTADVRVDLYKMVSGTATKVGELVIGRGKVVKPFTNNVEEWTEQIVINSGFLTGEGSDFFLRVYLDTGREYNTGVSSDEILIDSYITLRLSRVCDSFSTTAFPIVPAV